VLDRLDGGRPRGNVRRPTRTDERRPGISPPASSSAPIARWPPRLAAVKRARGAGRRPRLDATNRDRARRPPDSAAQPARQSIPVPSTARSRDLAGFPPRDRPMGLRACCRRVRSNNIYESATAVFQRSAFGRVLVRWHAAAIPSTLLTTVCPLSTVAGHHVRVVKMLPSSRRTSTAAPTSCRGFHRSSLLGELGQTLRFRPDDFAHVIEPSFAHLFAHPRRFTPCPVLGNHANVGRVKGGSALATRPMPRMPPPGAPESRASA
jgi:hypothetical protein